MRTARFATLAAVLAALALVSFGDRVARAEHHELPRHDSVAGTELYIISPKDGATVSSPVRVLFGLRGMGVAPAGVDMPNTGHHHLVIDAPLPDLNAPLPTSKHNLHFGGGQTETSLELSDGKHTLQLVLGDKNHVPQLPPVVSKQISITVK